MRAFRLLSRQTAGQQMSRKASLRLLAGTRTPVCTGATYVSRRFRSDAAANAEREALYADLDIRIPETPPKKTQNTTPYPAPTVAQPFTEEAKKLADGFGFLFDIDGVLYRGSSRIPSAPAALRLCYSHDTNYLFLTNGGGTTNEHEKAESLRKKMGIRSEDGLFNCRVVQSHTPLQTFNKTKMENDLIYTTSTDPQKARTVLKQYGFGHVVIANDFMAQNSAMFPFDKGVKYHKAAESTPRESAEIWHGGNNPAEYVENRESNHLKVDQIFILNDPRDWALETQLIYDILVSHRGYVGTLSRKNGDTSLPNNGWQQDSQPTIWVSNLDLFWKNEYPINRFGTGAFLHALRAVWKEATGQELIYRHMGKPSQITYDYAHTRLLAPTPKTGEKTPPTKTLRRVYMVGDNPESDIRGALEYKPADGTQYVPILVKTGVWTETETEKTPKWEPAAIVDDVLDAVVWAMRQEGIDIDRQTAMEKLNSAPEDASNGRRADA